MPGLTSSMRCCVYRTRVYDSNWLRNWEISTPVCCCISQTFRYGFSDLSPDRVHQQAEIEIEEWMVNVIRDSRLISGKVVVCSRLTYTIHIQNDNSNPCLVFVFVFVFLVCRLFSSGSNRKVSRLWGGRSHFPPALVEVGVGGRFWQARLPFCRDCKGGWIWTVWHRRSTSCQL